MNLLRKVKEDEKGSATIEFLGIVPIAFLALAIIIQFVVGINAVLMTHSAANEYASVYSMTDNRALAKASAEKIINSTGDYLTMSNAYDNGGGNARDFTANVQVNIRLMFIPEKIFGYSVPTVPFTAKASGRIIK